MSHPPDGINGGVELAETLHASPRTSLASGLRVLHVIPSVSASSGGPARAMAQIEQVLAARGVVVVTATTDDDGPTGRLDVPLGRRQARDGVERIYFSCQTRFYKVSVPLVRWLLRNVPSFDVVHVHSVFSFAPVVAAAIARNRGVPYVIRPLGVLSRYGMEKRRSWIKALSTRLIEARLLTDASAVHFTSGQEQQEAELLGIRMRARVIPLGISPMHLESPEVYQARFPGAAFPHLLFVSRIDRKKNLEGLLQAFSIILRQHPGARLTVCGDGDQVYLQEARILADELGISGHVVWAGHVEGRMKASVFASADLFVLPSFSENFGIAAVEALGAGLPCVLGRGVSVADEIQAAGAGIAVLPEADAVASAVCQLLDDDGLRARAGEAARVLASECYSPDAMADHLCLLYAELADAQSKEPCR